MGKIPWLAAVMNFLMWGLGYLYLGKRGILGWALVLAWGLWVFVYEFWAPATGILVLGFVFAFDAYQLAKKPPLSADDRPPRS